MPPSVPALLLGNVSLAAPSFLSRVSAFSTIVQGVRESLYLRRVSCPDFRTVSPARSSASARLANHRAKLSLDHRGDAVKSRLHFRARTRDSTPPLGVFRDYGAQERTRTSTPLRELAPEASASANSATWAFRAAIRGESILPRSPWFVNEARLTGMPGRRWARPFCSSPAA
jgi:hypothetical protein